MDGRSFVSVLAGSDEGIYSEVDVIAMELHGQRYLLRGDWKIIWEQRPINMSWVFPFPERWQTWQLFNLADDPTEQNNLADEHPEILAELVALWEAWAEENNVMKEVTAKWPPPGAPERFLRDD
jgi:arylsulfatase